MNCYSIIYPFTSVFGSLLHFTAPHTIPCYTSAQPCNKEKHYIAQFSLRFPIHPGAQTRTHKRKIRSTITAACKLFSIGDDTFLYMLLFVSTQIQPNENIIMYVFEKMVVCLLQYNRNELWERIFREKIDIHVT